MMEKTAMRIHKYHMIVRYPYLLLEAKTELENGDIVYPNICIPNTKGCKIDKDYSFYGGECVYNKPIEQVDFDNEDEYSYVMDERENMEMFDALIKIWNQNPVFEPEAGWKDYEENI